MESGSINIIMSIDEVKDIIRLHLCTKGHIVNRDDIDFNISIDKNNKKNLVENCVVKIKP